MLDYFLSRCNSFSLETNGLTSDNLLSRSKREFFYSPDSNILIIGIPAWGQSLARWRYVKKWAKFSSSSVLLYEFPCEILSNDHTLTEKTFDVINRTIREDIQELKNKYKFKKCVIVGISLGSSYGSMIYKENSNITDIILVCPGNNLALNMWNGCRTQHFRKSYEKQGINSAKINEYWRELASENNMPAPGTNVTILYAKHDKVILYSESKTLAITLQSHGLKVNTKNYNCGHYLLILYFLLFPHKIMNKIIS